MAASAVRMAELSMPTELAKEVASQIDDSVSGADEAVANLAPVIAAVATPAAYSETPADIAAALVAAGLMEASG